MEFEWKLGSWKIDGWMRFTIPRSSRTCLCVAADGGGRHPRVALLLLLLAAQPLIPVDGVVPLVDRIRHAAAALCEEGS